MGKYQGYDTNDGHQFGLTVTGTNWTTVRAIGIAYVDCGGNWRLRFNIEGTISVATANITLTFGDLTFKAANFNQATCAWFNNNRAVEATYVIPNTATIYYEGSDTFTNMAASGDVELDSKPDWIE